MGADVGRSLAVEWTDLLQRQHMPGARPLEAKSAPAGENFSRGSTYDL